jgi:hypothetical protein
MDGQEQTTLAQLHDIYGMIHVPFWQKPIFYVVLCVLGILVIMLYWYYIRGPQRQRSAHAWEQALYELEQLERHGLSDGNQQKLFYSKLTRIIKEYLQKRFGISLTSKTDDELLMLSASLDITQEVRQGLQDILDGVVFIKFAQEAAVRERMQRDLSAGKELVNATRPRKT